MFDATHDKELLSYLAHGRYTSAKALLRHSHPIQDRQLVSALSDAFGHSVLVNGAMATIVHTALRTVFPPDWDGD